MSFSSSKTVPHEVDNCRGVLSVYSDGSIRRSTEPSFHVPVRDDGSVSWKDVEFDPHRRLSLRLFKPSVAASSPLLPIFFYFHGGGFCIGSRTWPHCQNYSLRLSAELPALVVAPDYRLAPEHRLPTAIEDGFAAVEWLRRQAEGVEPVDEWLRGDVADFGNVFVSGDSAGGNIAHHLAAGLRRGSPELGAVRVRGYVLLAPFFGGTVLTESEAEGPIDAFLNLELIDRFWRLSKPIGESTDHPIINPFGPKSKSLEEVELDPILVVVGSSDLLKDRAHIYATQLKTFGKNIEYLEFQGQQHGFFTMYPDSDAANDLMLTIKRFIAQNSN